MSKWMMRMKKLIVILLAAATCAGARVQAQELGGLIMNKESVVPNDLVDFSQTQFNFGTARSMAMAGAFTSLGADQASMSINPAGLGMYRHSDISITPMMSFAKSSTNAAAYGSNSKNRFSMSNIGVVLNAYQGTGSLVSLSVGIGYNRLADFNYNYSFQRQGQGASIGDAFGRQMVWSGLSKNSFYTDNGSGSWNWNGINPELWNAALAYRAFLIDQVDPAKPDSWQPTWIDNNADVGHYTTLQSKGAIGEYVLSVGANINNKFYIGATLGIQSVYQRKYIDYAEDYVYATPSKANPEFGTADLDYQLLYSKLNQSVVVDGTGVNFKLGVVYRPIPNLRLGWAIHTPTYYSLDRKFQGSAAGMAYANKQTDPNVKPDANGYISTDGDPNMTTPILEDSGPDSWSFVSPTRMLFGASYTFGQMGVISVDYERDWYNGIRMKDNPSTIPSDFYNDTFRDVFKGSHTLRIGAEFKPLPRIALRAGYGFSGSMFKDDKTVLASPVIKQTSYYTAGLGFMLSRRVVLDFAYQYVTSKTTDYYLFYASDEAGATDSAVYSTDINRHNAALTLGFRF